MIAPAGRSDSSRHIPREVREFPGKTFAACGRRWRASSPTPSGTRSCRRAGCCANRAHPARLSEHLLRLPARREELGHLVYLFAHNCPEDHSPAKRRRGACAASAGCCRAPSASKQVGSFSCLPAGARGPRAASIPSDPPVQPGHVGTVRPDAVVEEVSKLPWVACESIVLSEDDP
jgi:hypothetical protein